MSWLSKVAGSVVGGVFGLVGANKANKQQASQFSQNYELAHDQLYKQHQIEVADLRAAGLNPILVVMVVKEGLAQEVVVVLLA